MPELDKGNLRWKNAEVTAGIWLGTEGEPNKAKPVEIGDVPRLPDDPAKTVLILARQFGATRLDRHYSYAAANGQSPPTSIDR